MNALLRNRLFLQVSGELGESGELILQCFNILTTFSILQPGDWRKHLENANPIDYSSEFSPEWIPSPYGREGYLWVAALPVEEFPPVFYPTTPDTTRRTQA